MSSKNIPQPPVPDLARAQGKTSQEVCDWLIEYYNKPRVPWNYQSGTRIIKQAYKGFSSLPQLLAGCLKENTVQGRASNSDIVRLAAPLAFGRKLQVFDLPPKQFEYGQNFRSKHRIPFFFTENGIVKLFLLQPRQGQEAALTASQLGFIAAIHKRYLLDEEFYDLLCDVEYVDLARDGLRNERVVRSYSLSDISMWSETALEERLSVIAEALHKAYESKKIVERPRYQRPAEGMPLF